MAGRGCTIIVKVLGGSLAENDKTEELSLPVALHSPLEVLKEQLASLVGIAIADQVLILCDLNDPERNSDILLNGRDFMPLRDIGIRNGSVLTLHALGMSAEKKKILMKKALETNSTNITEKTEIIHVLNTPNTVAEADHSYNGVIFDVSCDGPFEIDLVSVSIGGMLGRVRIFARDRGWEENKPKPMASPHWWAHRESLSKEGWIKVADIECRPSWDRAVEIKFDKSVKLMPHTRRAIYCHSGLPDDLGIQYQSFTKSDIIADDEYITIHPGLGHTGSSPFDDQHGWYRAYRGLAGSVKYTMKWKGWSIFEHQIFPIPLKNAVKALLLCQNHIMEAPQSPVTRATSTSVIEDNTSIDWKNDSPLIIGKKLINDVRKKKNFKQNSNNSSNDSNDEYNTKMPADDTSPKSPQHKVSIKPKTLSSLPKYVIYNILEFMNWDWFINVTIEEDWNEEVSEYEYLSGRNNNTNKPVTRSYNMKIKAVKPAIRSDQRNIQSSLLRLLQGSLRSSDLEVLSEAMGGQGLFFKNPSSIHG
eukprot:gene12587-16879_t